MDKKTDMYKWTVRKSIHHTVVLLHTQTHIDMTTLSSWLAVCYLARARQNLQWATPQYQCYADFTPLTRTIQNCLVLSCPCRQCKLNWQRDTTVMSRLGLVSSLNFVLFRPSFQCANVQSQIYWGLLKTVLTCHQFSSHHRHGQNKTFCLVCVVGVSDVKQALANNRCT